ncbi:MAG: hypothetical protein K6G27_07075 [Lachnospiraceae bacterium]|nr:hypothetical protein [Lachnospiraceae bacterium]
MKDLSTNTISTIISMCSVLVMFIWGYIEGTFMHSWLAVFAGGIIVVIIRMIRKDKDNKGNSYKQ